MLDGLIRRSCVAVMSRLLEADLTWTGTRFEPGVQIAIGGDGRIEAVGSAGRAGAERLHGIALLPGFVDAHSHAFQRGLRGRGRTLPAPVPELLDLARGDVRAGRLARPREAAPAHRAQAFGEMRDAGITTVGEFHYVHHERDGDFALDEAVLEAAADVGIRIVLLYSYYATGAPGPPLEGPQRRFATPSIDGFWRQVDRLAPLLDPATQTLGVAPHSIRAASPDEIAAISRRSGAARPAGAPARRGAAARDRGVDRRLRRARPWRRSSTRSRRGLHGRALHPYRASRHGAVPRGGRDRLPVPANRGQPGRRHPAARPRALAGGRLAIGTDSNNRLAMLEEMRWLEYGQRLRGELRGALPDATGDVAPIAARRRDDRRSAGPRRAGRPDRPGCWADFVGGRPAAPAARRSAARHGCWRRWCSGGERGDRGDLRRRPLAGRRCRAI